ncbi:MAG: hypothetical protein DI533_22095 [Cereibacter sphaeroides]|uniref:DUF6468 domain-containing protein n=1 Tax=Cereibacter sphaeroides TaxID=1063 RepID=A0A2W5S690_CERSP|nr:MAG: hypothetical protein DI533_22095 [Cereibacter sphaeroides]
MMNNFIFPSPGLIANGLTIILCLAVLIQSARMMRNLKAVNIGTMGTVVLGLDHATNHARQVLNELKAALIAEGDQNARVVAESEAMRDELRTLIEIADNMASRLADAPKPPVIDPAPPTAPAADAAATVAYTPEPELAKLRALVAEYGRTRISIDRATHSCVDDGPSDLDDMQEEAAEVSANGAMQAAA